jgi:phage tail-like protein
MSSTDFFKPDTSPPTEFYFSVNFSGMTGLIDSSFQEVSGLKATFGVEERKEGGENRFVHSFPTPPKLENLVLKRCLMPNSKLDKWCSDTINNFKFSPRDIHISLLGAGNQKILASWNVVHAFPISWELSTLNSKTNELAIETLTLNYRHFKREI